MTPLYRLLFNFPAPGRATPASRRLCGAQSRHGLAREIRSPWPPPHALHWGGYDALASELGGGSAMHHFDRPSRNRSRPRLIPLRPYSVMVFFSRHSRESGDDGKSEIIGKMCREAEEVPVWSQVHFIAKSDLEEEDPATV